MSDTTNTQHHKHTNRLIHETSPYLLQHAHNPVDWYPWGLEASEAARAQGKPTFLSVGYTTCYWCHVMERQRFGYEAIAREPNERSIYIRRHREGRPSADRSAHRAVHRRLRADLRRLRAGAEVPAGDVAGVAAGVSARREFRVRNREFRVWSSEFRREGRRRGPCRNQRRCRSVQNS